MNRILFVSAAFFAATTFVACDQIDSAANQPELPIAAAHDGDQGQCQDLLNAEGEPIGKVCLDQDDDGTQVTLEADGITIHELMMGLGLGVDTDVRREGSGAEHCDGREGRKPATHTNTWILNVPHFDQQFETTEDLLLAMANGQLMDDEDCKTGAGEGEGDADDSTDSNTDSDTDSSTGDITDGGQGDEDNGVTGDDNDGEDTPTIPTGDDSDGNCDKGDDDDSNTDDGDDDDDSNTDDGDDDDDSDTDDGDDDDDSNTDDGGDEGDDDDTTTDGIDSCETAYAVGDATFQSLMNTPRWGWSLGALGEGVHTTDIYAGAGQNDLTKGTKVGTLQVDYDGSTAIVTYTMDAGFSMNETHLYVGSDALPSKNGKSTVAPGQYGHQNTLSAATTDTFEVTGLQGDIYVVAHAVTCAN